MSSVVLDSDKAVMGMDTVRSKLRVEPVGNIRDLFLLESIRSGAAVRFVKGSGIARLEGLQGFITCMQTRAIIW